MFQVDEATVNLLRLRWKYGVVVDGAGVAHVGAAQPFCKAWIRTARLKRSFHTVDPEEVYSHIPNLKGGRTIWKGEWIGHDSYRELPNLLEVELTTDFSQNGVTQATITMDNVAMEEINGVNGIYHAIQRGYYSPFRGFKPKGRTAVGEKNEWFDILNDKSTEIVIVAGYGEESAIPIFKGLVNDLDMDSSPDRIQILARDMGQFLTDQQVFINAKVRSVRDPITFADRRRAENAEEYRGGVEVSSEEPGKGGRFAVDNQASTFWLSNGNDHAGAMEDITMQLVAGRYESIRLNPQHPGQEVYIAVKARDKNAPGGEGAKKRYTEDLPDNEWVDEGLGTVPGHPGITYVKHIKDLKAKDKEYFFPDYGYVLGDDSLVRVFITNLQPTYQPPDRRRRFRAAIKEFSAVKRNIPQDVRKDRWILVDDVSDIVRTVLQWCGMDQEWEIEDTGVRLSDKIVFNRQNHLIDIINKIAEMTNYIFYVKPPSLFDSDDLAKTNPNHASMGIPVFRSNQAMRRAQDSLDPIEEVREDNLLTNIQPHWTDEPLAYNIRVRGKRTGKKFGRTLGGDDTRRFMYVYRPPWSREAGFPGQPTPGEFRNANLKKYAVHHDELLASVQECEIAALMIAFREALEAGKATCEFPAMPTIHLDHQVSVKDTSTGLSTRVWLTNRTMNIRLGENAHMKMAIGGALMDLPDVTTVREELVRSLRNAGYNPGLSQWELDYRNRPFYEPAHA